MVTYSFWGFASDVTGNS